jgi:hypothetical protein
MTRFEGYSQICQYDNLDKMDEQTNHSLDSPRCIVSLGLNRYAIIQGIPKVGTATDQNSDRVRVGGILG